MREVSHQPYILISKILNIFTMTFRSLIGINVIIANLCRINPDFSFCPTTPTIPYWWTRVGILNTKLVFKINHITQKCWNTIWKHTGFRWLIIHVIFATLHSTVRAFYPFFHSLFAVHCSLNFCYNLGNSRIDRVTKWFARMRLKVINALFS